MKVDIERADLADADTIRGCFEVFLAAQQVDEPEGPWFTERPFRGWLTVGWGGDPQEVWVVPGPAEGPVAGWYGWNCPIWKTATRPAWTSWSIRRSGGAGWAAPC